MNLSIFLKSLPLLLGFSLYVGCQGTNNDNKTGVKALPPYLQPPVNWKSLVERYTADFISPYFETSNELSREDVLPFFENSSHIACRKKLGSLSKTTPVVPLTTKVENQSTSTLDPLALFNLFPKSEKRVVAINTNLTLVRNQKIFFETLNKTKIWSEAQFKETLVIPEPDDKADKKAEFFEKNQYYVLVRKILNLTTSNNIVLSDEELSDEKKRNLETYLLQTSKENGLISQLQTKMLQPFGFSEENSALVQDLFESMDKELTYRNNCTYTRLLSNQDKKTIGLNTTKFFKGSYLDSASQKWDAILEVETKTSTRTCKSDKLNVVNAKFTIYTRSTQAQYETCLPMEVLTYELEVDLKDKRVLYQTIQTLNQLKQK